MVRLTGNSVPLPVQIMRGVDWAIVRQYLTLKGGPGKAPAAPAKKSSTDQQRQQQQRHQSKEGPSALGVMNYLRNTMHHLGPRSAAAAEAAASSSSSGGLREPLVAGSSRSIDGSEEPPLGGSEGGRRTGGGGGDSAADAAVWPLVSCFKCSSSSSQSLTAAPLREETSVTRLVPVNLHCLVVCASSISCSS